MSPTAAAPDAWSAAIASPCRIDDWRREGIRLRAPAGHHLANPIRKAGRRRNGPVQIRQLEVRVRVHEPGHQRHMPQVALVAICVIPAALPEPADSAIQDVDPSVVDGRGHDGQDPPGPQSHSTGPLPRPDAMHNARCTMNKGALHRRIAHSGRAIATRRTRTAARWWHRPVHRRFCIVHCALCITGGYPPPVSVRAAFPVLLLAG